MRYKKDKKIIDTLCNYNRQLCKCGHSVLMVPSTKYCYCSHCGRKIINKTKGHFIKEMWERLR